MLKKMFRNLNKYDYSDESKVILINDAVNIVYECSKACYSGELSNKFSTRLKHVKARVNAGHESVTEHSNIVMLVPIINDDIAYLVDCIGGFKYLNSEVSIINGITYVLIGGSTRAYKDLIRSCSFPNHNKFIIQVKNNLYQVCYKEFFLDMIEAGIMDDNFIGMGAISDKEWMDMEDLSDKDSKELQDAVESYNNTHPIKSNSKLVDIINCDNVCDIYDEVKRYGFTINQCMKMATITIKFKDISRCAGMQLNRHRNAITQESQRYVDYSEKSFKSPAMFKPEKYHYDTYQEPQFYIGLCNSDKMSGTMEYLGNASVETYKVLVKYGIDKEDARYLLPEGIPCNIYMTFTFKNLIHFLDLRTNPAAQVEIRTYANEINNLFRNYLSSLGLTEEDLNTYNLPKYMLIDAGVTENDIVEEAYDGDESDGEEVVNLTENDKRLREAIKENNSTWSPEKYASTRESEKEIKIAESGKRDV